MSTFKRVVVLLTNWINPPSARSDKSNKWSLREPTLSSVYLRAHRW